MSLSVGKILGISAGYKAGNISKPEFTLANNFIQQSVSSAQTYNLNHPAQANSTPYGESPRAKHLDLLA